MIQQETTTNNGVKLIQLLSVFLRISPAAFGGGYSMLPMLEREIVERKSWIDKDEMNDLLSIAGSTPGGVGVNAAGLIGYRIAGVGGAICAVIGMTLPTFLIVFLLGIGYSLMEGSDKAFAAFQGVKGAVIGLIFVAAYKMAQTSLFDRSTVILFAVSVAALLLALGNPIYLIAGGLVTGGILVRIKEKLGFTVNTEVPKFNPQGSNLYAPEYYI